MSAVPPATPAGWVLNGLGGPKTIDSVAIDGLGRIELVGSTLSSSDVTADYAGGPTIFSSASGKQVAAGTLILFGF